MPLLSLVSLGWSAELPRYSYTRPQGSTAAGVVVFTKWSPGQLLHAAGGLTVAPTPGAKGAPVPLGALVRLVRVGEVATVEGSVNAWYEVQFGSLRGWAFGAHLTPLAFVGDFDGDAQVDNLTVSFTASHGVRIQLDDQSLEVPAVGGGFLGLEGAGLVADMVPAPGAGVPVLHVYTGVEACGDFADYWVTFPAGAPRVAHREVGLIDPPNCFRYDAAFTPGALQMTYSGNACAEDGSAPEVTTKRLRLLDSQFIEQARVDAILRKAGKWLSA